MNTDVSEKYTPLYLNFLENGQKCSEPTGIRDAKIPEENAKYSYNCVKSAESPSKFRRNIALPFQGTGITQERISMNIISRDLSVTIDGFWIDRIYWTL
jgi:hypothetical protein